MSIIVFFLLANLFFAGFILFKVSRLVDRSEALDSTVVSLNLQYIRLEETVGAQKEMLDGLMNTLLRVQAQLFRLGPGTTE